MSRDFDIFMSKHLAGQWLLNSYVLFTVVFHFLFYSIEKTVCIFMQTVPLISDAAVFRFLHSHKTGLHLNHAEKSLNHILRVLISREKHLKDKQFSWLQFITSNSFPEFLSSSGSCSRLPVTVAGPQRIDTVFSINAYCNLYPECNADVILTEKIRFHKVFMYSI